MRFPPVSLLLAIGLVMHATSAPAQQVAQFVSRSAYALPGGAPDRKQVPGVKCRTCTGYEMGTIDPSRLIGEPQKAVAKKYKGQPVKKKRKPVHHVIAKTTPVIRTAPPYPVRHVLKAHVAVRAPKPSKSKCNEVMAHMQDLLATRQDDSAEIYLKNALAEYPNDLCIRRALVRMLLCEAYNFMKCGEIECAARRLREVLFVDARNQQAIALLDKCYEAAGVDPHDSRTMRKIASNLLKKGRTVGAFVEYERLLDSAPDLDTYLGYARSAQQLGQSSIAMRAYEAAAKMEPNDNNIWRELGMVQQRAGKTSDAMSSLSTAVNLNPDDVLAGDNLVNLQKQLVQNDPNNPQKHLDLANTLAQTGLTAAAAAEYAQVAHMTNNSPQWAQSIANGKEQAAFWRQQSTMAKQYLAHKNQQNAVKDFENFGPSPLPPHATRAVSMSSKCVCD